VTFGSGGQRSIQLSYERNDTGGGISRVLSPLAGAVGSFLWDRRCRRPRAAYPGLDRGGPPLIPYLALLRVGFTMPRLSPDARCALTAPFHPCLCLKKTAMPASTAIGGVLSVALSVASRRPGVTRHPALWSSDFPRRRTPRRDPHSPPEFSIMPRRGLEPPRGFPHQILSLACLPVSAPGQLSADAPERTRTSTGLRPLDPESSASTSSATGAQTIHGAAGHANQPRKVRPEGFEPPTF
jgi:hypothetical protein